ncbi:MAG: acylphosphatase [Actinomycetota bacterium]|nr:acylphosphatase [Actinomycetota bacterium]
MSMAQVRRRIVVHGQVQGVFFRDGSQREAERRGLTGWVRNRADGTVEVAVQGNADAVDAFARWAERGPSAADVNAVDVEDEAPIDGESRFEVR